MTQQNKFSPEFKARLVLEIITDQKSTVQSYRKIGIKDLVLSRWKNWFIERSPQLFEQGTVSDDRDQRIAESERMVGRLVMEPEITKKVSRFMGALQTIIYKTRTMLVA